MGNLYFKPIKISQILETLYGLIEGIQADGRIEDKEIDALEKWHENNKILSLRPPFNEIFFVLQNVLSDKKVTAEELLDVKFVCSNLLKLLNLSGNNSSSLQRLHGLAAGIALDKVINQDEWRFISDWVNANVHLKGCWPYDEIDFLISKHSQVDKLTPDELGLVIHYFNDFCGLNNNSALTHPLNELNQPISGICASCPDIEIDGKAFCMTGKSDRRDKSEIASLIIGRGGFVKADVSPLIDYLVVLSQGDPRYAFGCYGRKVERAVQLRKSGHRILIVQEIDFWDFLQEAA